jgi:hypothetical protein
VSADREPGAVADGTVVTCPSCRLDFDHFADPGEAQYFAAGHNDLHGHGACISAYTVDADDHGDIVGDSDGSVSDQDVPAAWAASAQVRGWPADDRAEMEARVQALESGVEEDGW